MENPLYRPEDLGKPIPDSKHAVSVCLPKWADVVDYEEGEERVIEAMQAGYPRFFYHPLVEEFFAECERKFAREGEFCIAFPSKRIAEQCVKYIAPYVDITGRTEPYGAQDVYVCCLPEAARACAGEFWQHTGMIINSRQAEAVLSGNFPAEDNSKNIIKQRIAGLSGEDEDNIYLFPSGMGAIFTAHQAITDINPQQKTIQLGFPYVDSLKVQEKFGAGVHFLKYNDDNDLAAVEEIIRNEKIAAVFCEFPGNPLLQSIALDKLSEILRVREVPLIIDDTVATWYNVDLREFADITTTSLTKFFAGSCDVIAGSLVINSASPLYDKLKPAVDNIYEDLLFTGDAQVLEKNSRDFSGRMEKINGTTEVICDYLRNHPEIKQVYYPKYITPDTYNRLKRPGAGYGGLFSVTFSSEQKAIDFYDNIEICKGPSLGTNFTLACPYTLLAHYHELDFAAKFGIEANLIRISIGLEDADDLVSKFEKALML